MTLIVGRRSTGKSLSGLLWPTAAHVCLGVFSVIAGGAGAIGLLTHYFAPWVCAILIALAAAGTALSWVTREIVEI